MLTLAARTSTAMMALNIVRLLVRLTYDVVSNITITPHMAMTATSPESE